MFTIYGHRGLPSKAPENTLASFKAASEVEGARWLELDVGITKDQQLVIIHDDYLDRTTNKTGEVTQLNYAEMKDTSAGLWYGSEFKEEKLPTFEQIIRLANDYQMNLNVELKGVTGPRGTELSHSMVTQVREQLQALDDGLQVVISSFNLPLLKMSEERMPEYTRAVLFKNAYFKEDFRTVMDFCNSKIVNIENAKLTESKVKMIKEAGYELNVWTVNKDTRANQLANWGVDGIFTDKIDQLIHLQQREDN
ncbi:glycerophosphoryl diester phosphodiesterase [Staphylococcus sp. SQ8-PEA]|uniref:Glycerophosphoryl diester phosphodiesterase n=1 Tax=Staphylococcus marylandisciuri TaxID=2981529 RepID=A0ABT2QN74_9STAP|nr:glycerophosphoryl diester phosphodiesterase [Staphylococcus marylandisciuri]MCU5745431.1 glycerophosphoryl diester phosphodiesterase [Staphylococcus marylandisciuri]